MYVHIAYNSSSSSVHVPGTIIIRRRGYSLPYLELKQHRAGSQISAEVQIERTDTVLIRVYRLAPVALFFIVTRILEVYRVVCIS